MAKGDWLSVNRKRLCPICQNSDMRNKSTRRLLAAARPATAQACLNVAYPSGFKFNLSGHFVLAPLGSWLVPTILGPNNQAVVLDQRAIVTHDGCLIYSPRRNRDALNPLITQWLDQHPDWANGHEVGHDGESGGAV